MKYFIDLLLIFFAYSFLGWCIEVTLKYFEFHRFINRGFLTGPWLPIYGSGAVLITVAVGLLNPLEHGYGTTFAVSFILCGVLEYSSSYILEKRYHARWWDYTGKPMNLNGRVWIGNLILFGLGGVAIIHAGNPLLYRLFSHIGLTAREITASVLAAVFIADVAVSRFVMRLVKTGVESSTADNTEEISREVRLLLSDRAYFYRRFADAYPEVIYRTDRVKARMERVKAETERLRAEAEKRVSEARVQAAANIADVREQAAAGIADARDQLSAAIDSGRSQLASYIDPASSDRAELLRRQEELIDLLYDEKSAGNEARALKKEIQILTKRLKD